MSVQKEVDGSIHKHLLQLNEQLRTAFGTVNEEFEDHLDAINENTEELHCHHEALSELNRKIEKLNDRLDEMRMLVKQTCIDRKDIRLSFDEQKAFIILYTHESGFLSFDEIVAKCGFSADYTRSLVNSMLDKGVSLIREITDGNLFFKLNPRFRALQAKENMVKIEPAVISQIENRVLGNFF